MLARRSAAAVRTAGCGVRERAGLQAADGDDFLPGPDLKREGAAAAADNGEGLPYSGWSGGTAPLRQPQTRRAESSLAGSSLGR